MINWSLEDDKDSSIMKKRYLVSKVCFILSIITCVTIFVVLFIITLATQSADIIKHLGLFIGSLVFFVTVVYTFLLSVAGAIVFNLIGAISAILVRVKYSGKMSKTGVANIICFTVGFITLVPQINLLLAQF